MRRLYIRALALCVMGAFVGIAYNVTAEKPLPWIGSERVLEKAVISENDASPSESDLTSNAPQSVALEQAYRLFKEGRALFLDAREPVEYAEGHIAGARSLPYEEMDDFLSAVLADYQDGTPVLCYCGGKECKASLRLGEALSELGIHPVYVFFGGWQKWQSAGYPVKTGMTGN